MRWTILAVALLLPIPSPAAEPDAPYYSVQVGSTRSIGDARVVLRKVSDLAATRIEERGKYFAVRVGAYATRAEASEALAMLVRRGFRDAAIMRVTQTVKWLDASGPAQVSAPTSAKLEPAKTLELPAPPPPTPVPAKAPQAATATDSEPAPPPPLPKNLDVPPAEYDFRSAAQALDWQVRNLVNRDGVARRDGYTYTLDLAWLMRYAARRGDREFYTQLRASADDLVLDNAQNPFISGFVLWRYKRGEAPEVTGTAEAMHLARALWEASLEFDIDSDRRLALKIIDGYARHAFEIGDDWLVRKYYAFGNNVFANMSVIGSYLPDFLASVESSRGSEESGPSLAARSYGVIERAVHENTGLLHPVLQPEINQTYPGLDISVYAPNNVLPVADSCDGAESVVRRNPDIAEEFLEFFHDRDRRDRVGYPYAYFRGSAKRVTRHIVGTPTIACMARLAVAVGDDKVLAWLRPIILLEMESLAAVPAVQEAPLFGAGPMLIAALEMGGFRE